MPRSVPIIYWALGTLVISASRFAAKGQLWRSGRFAASFNPVLICGADEAGALLAAALRRGGSHRIISLFDDNKAIVVSAVAGSRVFSPMQLPGLKESYGVRKV